MVETEYFGIPSNSSEKPEDLIELKVSPLRYLEDGPIHHQKRNVIKMVDYNEIAETNTGLI